jgi:hypothetical protein
MLARIEEVKKLKSNNVKIILTFTEDIPQKFADTFVAVTFGGRLTVHGKSSKISVHARNDLRRASLSIMLSQEKDILLFLDFIGYPDNWLYYSSFSIFIIEDIDIKIIELDGKEFQYREKLFKQIYAIYENLKPMLDGLTENIDIFLKEKFKIKSKKDLSIPELEDYRNKLIALEESLGE